MIRTKMTLVGCIAWLTAAGMACSAEPASPPPRNDAPNQDQVQPVIDRVEKACLERTVYMIGRVKAERLAELVRRAKPKVVVECGTALGYSGLWIARELQTAGSGKLITIEISPQRAREAEATFREAGLADIVTVKVGDATKVVHQIKGPVDFVFIDCGYSNYLPCLSGLEDELSKGATIVADNVGIGASGLGDYLKHVQTKYTSRTEWFDIELPWAPRDAMEISVVAK